MEETRQRKGRDSVRDALRRRIASQPICRRAGVGKRWIQASEAHLRFERAGRTVEFR